MNHLTAVIAIFLFPWTISGSQGIKPVSAGNGRVEASSQERSRYQREVETKLRDLDREMRRAKSKAPEKSEELRKQFDREMAELDQKRQIAREKLEKLKISSQKAWRDLKPGMDAAIKDLDEACKRAASEFN